MSSDADRGGASTRGWRQCCAFSYATYLTLWIPPRHSLWCRDKGLILSHTPTDTSPLARGTVGGDIADATVKRNVTTGIFGHSY